MYTTKTQLKKEVREELQCPSEFIRHLARFDTFDQLKESVVSDDRQVKFDVLKDIRQAYKDYCHETGLDYNTDNRKARVGFFIY